jgi:hypothetical protein
MAPRALRADVKAAIGQQIISWQTMTSFGSEALERAAQHHVNTLILEFEPNPEQPGRQWNTLLDDLSYDDFAPLVAKTGVARQNVDKLRKNLAHLTSEGKKQGIAVYIVVTEVSLPIDMLKLYPQTRDVHGEFLWKFLEARLQSVFQALPDLAGIVLYTDESAGFTLYNGSLAENEAALVHLFNLYHDVSRQQGRKLIVTTFLDYDPIKMTAMLGALDQIAPAQDFIVDNYICPGDWGLIALINPAIAKVKHQQFISFDYTGENWGQANLPLCEADLLYRGLNTVRQSGGHVIGMNGYVTWYTQSIFGTPTEINLDLAYSLLNDAALQPEQAVDRLLRARYGAQAAPILLPAFMQSWQEVQESTQALGLWVSEAPKSAYPPPAWIAFSVRTESLAVWDAQYKPLEEEFARPDEKLLRKIIAEKDHAVVLADAGLKDVERAKPYLKPEDYQLLKKQFTLALYVAREYRMYFDLFLRFRMWDQAGRGPLPGQIPQLQKSLSAFTHEMHAAMGDPPVFCPASMYDNLRKMQKFIDGEKFPDYWNKATPLKEPEVNFSICAHQD